MIEALILLIVVIVAIGARRRLRTLNARIARLETTVERFSASRVFVPAIEAEAAAVDVPVEPAVAETAVSPEPVAPAEPVAPVAPTAPPGGGVPPPPPRTASARGHQLEERFGTRWVVWVGGLALALGAVFLVQYSIEQGLLGPGARIFLGGLLAAVLIAAGEWTRRREVPLGMAGMPSAYIPGILTAAGTIAAFATAYAAYALYGFLNPATAFVLLGIVALATLAAALIHRPLAALGVLGAYVTPISSPACRLLALSSIRSDRHRGRLALAMRGNGSAGGGDLSFGVL
jgi:uncharacterized membrane protein